MKGQKSSSNSNIWIVLNILLIKYIRTHCILSALNVLKTNISAVRTNEKRVSEWEWIWNSGLPVSNRKKKTTFKMAKIERYVNSQRGFSVITYAIRFFLSLLHRSVFVATFFALFLHILSTRTLCTYKTIWMWLLRRSFNSIFLYMYISGTLYHRKVFTYNIYGFCTLASHKKAVCYDPN